MCTPGMGSGGLRTGRSMAALGLFSDLMVRALESELPAGVSSNTILDPCKGLEEPEQVVHGHAG